MKDKYLPDRTIQSYIRYINEAEKLTEEETADLVQEARNGDMQAHDRLFTSHAYIILYCFRTGNYTQNYNNDMADFLQEGALGLLRAIDYFSPQKGASFSTYAVFWVRKYLWDYCRRNQLIVKPDKRFRLLSKLYQARREYKTEYGRYPDTDTLAGMLSLPPEEARQAEADLSCFCIFAKDAFPFVQGSDDEKDSNNPENFLSLYCAGDDVESLVLERAHNEELYRELTGCLHQKIDRDILDLILFSDNDRLSHAKIAVELSFSRAYISKRAITMRDKVKEIMLELNPDLSPEDFQKK